MSVLSNIHKKLIERNFKDCEEEVCGYKIYTNGIYQVFSIKINKFIELPKIMEDLSELRKYIINRNFNIWNTYVIFCIEDDEVDKCFTIELERDNRYFRKYVVKASDEIDRISFLAMDVYENEENKINLSEEITFKEEFSLNVFKHIDEYGLKDKKLNNNEVVHITKNIFRIAGVEYENK